MTPYAKYKHRDPADNPPGFYVGGDLMDGNQQRILTFTSAEVIPANNYMVIQNTEQSIDRCYKTPYRIN